jgi:crotonobetainyl-CoA:carnitine CoA-transferase CaiB-like acyl-CoA transferase
MKNNTGPLNGVRVLDLTRVLSGASCGMHLADLGADVIKVEVPNHGDDSRQFGPFLNGESLYFMNINRNKRGVTLNLKGKGRDILFEMVKKADIIIENFRPGVMDKLGLGYEDLKKVNPKIIYGSVSCFGQTGPYSKRAGYDIVAQAMSGLMSVTGYPEGTPTRAGTGVCDVMGGMSLAIGILAALNHRNITGEGQMVDIALLDAAITSMQIIQIYYVGEGRIPQRIGNRYESNYPMDLFEAKDGFFVIGTANNKLWELVCEIIGYPELASMEKYNEPNKRVEHHAEIKPLINAWARKQTLREGVAAMVKAGVPCGPVYNIAEMMADEHVNAREMFVDVDHPKVGKTKICGTLFKLSSSQAKIRRPAPVLGEHNYEVYKEVLGLSKEEVDKMLEEKTI